MRRPPRPGARWLGRPVAMWVRAVTRGGARRRQDGGEWLEKEDKADRWGPPISDSHEERGRGAGGAQCRPALGLGRSGPAGARGVGLDGLA